MIAAALARHLTTAGIVDYRANDAGGDTFIDHTPSKPDRAVTITGYRANDVDGGSALHGYDEPVIQIKTRAATPRAAHDLAKAIYSELVGLTSRTIAEDTVDETYVVLVTSEQGAPYHLPGVDENGRHEYVVNVAVHHRSLTTHRV